MNVESGITRQHVIDECDVEAGASPRRTNGSLGRPTPVILDSGNRAEVVVLPAEVPVGLGTRFRHRNASWVIVGRRNGSGILVAVPAEH